MGKWKELALETFGNLSCSSFNLALATVDFLHELEEEVVG